MHRAFNLSEEENESSQDERLNKLASFQLLMIKHAMKFPSVQKIVYSTCSVHATENEHVVKQALGSEEAKSGHFVLASRADVLPAWNRRGLADVMEDGLAEGLLRCSPGEDATNGFFVSCFVRVGASGQPDLGPQIAPVVEDSNSGKRKADDDGGGEDAERGKKKRPRKKKILGAWGSYYYDSMSV
ncbi:hypothetical protein EWM64_g1134 [Hericium alpestre]|uniref:SAM-dependent MTase RsmB/NOP-type domain-containing protein n=1 Tax=Hericium alpestre TaxID=135208 RepID=A0A4Z0A8L9_9AGAM|nr:hypothetical protein EWM64_g1134 [Hericium alpestre]